MAGSKSITTGNSGTQVEKARAAIEAGPVATMESEMIDPRRSRSHIQELSGHVGPKVYQAANRFQRNYLEGLDQDELEEDLAADPDEVYVDGAYAASEEEYEQGVTAPGGAPVANLPAIGDVARQALVQKADTANDLTTEVGSTKWHGFLNLAQNRAHQNFMRTTAGKMFSVFPCFDAKKQAQGMRAVDNMKTVLDIKIPPRPDPAQRALIAHPAMAGQLRHNAGDHEMTKIASWIKNHAIKIAASELSFPEIMPNYRPKVLVALSEDETFLLVEENRGVADYTFNAETGDFSAVVVEGKTIESADSLLEFKVDKAELKKLGADLDNDHFNIDFGDDSDLGLIIEGDKVVIYYSGDRTLTSGAQVLGTLKAGNGIDDEVAYDANPSQVLGRYIQENFLEPEGACDAGKGGVAPLDARYVYSWKGGRDHYRNNPEDLDKLVNMMTAAKTIEMKGSLNGGFELADTRREPIPAAIEEAVEEAPQTPTPEVVSEPVPAAPAAPAEVTQPEKREPVISENKPFKPLPVAARLGFRPAKFGPESTLVSSFEVNGGHLVMKPEDGKPLARSTAFSLGFSSDISAGEFFTLGQTTLLPSREALQETLRDLIDQYSAAQTPSGP